MTFLSGDARWWPFVFLLVAGTLATDMWRFLGVYFAGHLKEDAEILVFVRTMATALVAAVIAKLILYPDGGLAAVPAMLRVGAAGAGFAAYFLAGKRVFAGVVTAELALLLGMSLWA
ncbi:MAG: AzlD domain-containing protein [Rhizobiaceae bacterium]